MKRIAVIGAGLSASSLIDYLLKNSEEFDWHVTVADLSLETAERKIGGHPRGAASLFDVNDKALREKIVAESDLVVSMLPAFMHPIIAGECVKHGKHMVTASYVSEDMKRLNEDALKKDILLLNEIGVDPGIDHMSAMKVIDEIREDGGELLEFESSTGGLVAPEYDNNPWNYKFTWNPRNVVLAGQGTAKYLGDGKIRYIPYGRLFKRTKTVTVPGMGEFEIYANRDSVSYVDTYSLQGIKTLFRGTMRRPGYSEAWDIFIQLGITDDTYSMGNPADMTYREFINSFLPESEGKTEEIFMKYTGLASDSVVMEKIRWTGIFGEETLGEKDISPARALQLLLEKRWALEEGDKDMIVMQHRFIFEKGGVKKRIISSLCVKGETDVHTAMSITVGIPVAIAVKLILTGKITATGVVVPVNKDVYEPVLKELENYGIRFTEEEEIIS